jgi:hypothetical protein
VSPAEFGVMTATLIVIGAGRAIHAGIGPALVQREDLRPEHIRTGFSLCVLVAVAMAVLLWFGAPRSRPSSR